VRYTFAQTPEDYATVTREVIARQSWRRSVLIASVLGCIAIFSFLIFGNHSRSLVLMLEGVVWIFIIALLIVAMTGYTGPVGTAGLLTVSAVIVIAAKDPPKWTDHAVFILSYALVFGFAVLVTYLIKRRFGTNALYQCEMTVDLTLDEVRVVREASTSTYRWSSIVRATETPGHFLLFTTKTTAEFIPKRVVPFEELVDLQALLTDRVPSGLR
jgi:hypothetical protein